MRNGSDGRVGSLIFKLKIYKAGTEKDVPQGTSNVDKQRLSQDIIPSPYFGFTNHVL